MTKNIKRIDLLLSCPGDVQDELVIVNEVVQKYNNEVGRSKDVFIDVRHWKKSSFPKSGGKPQEILNKQFVLDCYIAIAIFWTRFGTTTDEFESGTEEEITRLIEQNKQVFLYFSQIPVQPNKIDLEQYKKIENFKNQYSDKGLYYEYNDIDEFKDVLFQHLCQYIDDKFRSSEVKLQHDKVAKIRNTKKFSILIDGCNFFKRINSMNIDMDIITNQFSLNKFGKTIQSYLKNKELECIEIICDKNTVLENSNLLERLKGENGVYVEELLKDIIYEQWTDEFKKYILDYSSRFDEIVVVTTNERIEDCFKLCRKMETKIITVEFNNDLPNCLKNQSHNILQLHSRYRDFFNYEYIHYNINDMTIKDYKNLISNGDDRKDNQLRVDYDGRVYLSRNTGAEKIHGVKFRWETYDSFNEYVGPNAASDKHYLEETFKEIKYDWENNLKGYIDYYRVAQI